MKEETVELRFQIHLSGFSAVVRRNRKTTPKE